ncbi:hypothetical protein [Halobacillus andaensis]|uniref:hypothetical protein n=1 Tax=Halobacillus andaensis TaxID=1176239 RepID=UPI00166AC691|nr:hypothetical protein [Halobacillus andaensis]MBP2006739.1 lipopolysaccharide export LptBFGC system permease protein LptF [Halobacillus andaensis]
MKKHFKNKRYWILMPTFLLAGIIMFIFLPNEYNGYSFLMVIILWVVFHVWNYFAEKKHKSEKIENST